MNLLKKQKSIALIIFLHLTILKLNNHFVFSIFHEPTHTDLIIDNSSLHPDTHKLAAVRCYIHRLLNTPLLPIDYTKELNIIKHIALNNGYKVEKKDKLIESISLKLALKSVYPIVKEKSNRFYSLAYFSKPSETIRLSSFETCNRLGLHIKNNKSTTVKLKKSGVYVKKCGTCNKVYICQTDQTDFNILHIATEGAKLNALESLEINKLKNENKLINDQLLEMKIKRKVFRNVRRGNKCMQ